jgi:azurin
MNLKSTLPLFICALLLAGCGKTDTPSANAPAAGGAESASTALEVEITANDSMKYSLLRIDAKVGQEIKIKFTNVGTLPKEAMGHNLIVLKKGTDVKAFADAALGAAATDYIPASLADQIIAHTRLLGARQSDEINFKLPEAGEYVYLCSFPAHYLTGMKGVIVVQ